MFDIKVTRLDHPEIYYSVEISLPVTIKGQLDYTEFYSFLYRLGDMLFGSEYKSAVFGLGVIYTVPVENCPECIKIMGDSGEVIYNKLFSQLNQK